MIRLLSDFVCRHSKQPDLKSTIGTRGRERLRPIGRFSENHLVSAPCRAPGKGGCFVQRKTHSDAANSENVRYLIPPRGVCSNTEGSTLRQQDMLPCFRKENQRLKRLFLTGEYMSFVFRNRDPWRWPAVILWLLFFAAGFTPETVYHFLRETAWVVTQRAWINSFWMLSIMLGGWFAFFTWQRCREARLSPEGCRARTLETGCAALVAFMPVPIDVVMRADRILIVEMRNILIGAMIIKSICWLYLLSIVLRYYLVDGYRVFRRIPSFFPSTRRRKNPPASLPQKAARPDDISG
jgi:hypothetical protein